MPFVIQKGVEQTKTKTFRIPTKLSDQLEEMAYKNHLSLNQVVVQCLEYAVSQIKENPDMATKD